MISSLPSISIITPSFNQVAFLERTICSVLDQNYPNLEYIIIDGGSTDGSVEIIKRYSSHLAFWVSEPDHGQAHAINKGLRIAKGEWVGWQNSDDIYYPESFVLLAERAARSPLIDFFIGDVNLIDAKDNVIREQRYVCPSYQSLLAEGMVLTNQAAFWRHGIHQQIGFLNETLHYGFDYEWFLRLLAGKRRSGHISEIMGALRLHIDTKSSRHQQLFTEEYKKILNLQKTMPDWKKKVYCLRRLCLTLANGHYRYITQGIVRRLLKPHDNDTRT